jgi:hypothetical protein
MIIVLSLLNYPQVDAVLGDGLPTLEDLKKLKYTTRVINEVSVKQCYLTPIMNFPLNKNITIVAVFETISAAASFDSPLP